MAQEQRVVDNLMQRLAQSDSAAKELEERLLKHKAMAKKVRCGPGGSHSSKKTQHPGRIPFSHMKVLRPSIWHTYARDFKSILSTPNPERQGCTPTPPPPPNKKINVDLALRNCGRKSYRRLLKGKQRTLLKYFPSKFKGKVVMNLENKVSKNQTKYSRKIRTTNSMNGLLPHQIVCSREMPLSF